MRHFAKAASRRRYKQKSLQTFKLRLKYRGHFRPLWSMCFSKVLLWKIAKAFKGINSPASPQQADAHDPHPFLHYYIHTPRYSFKNPFDWGEGRPKRNVANIYQRICLVKLQHTSILNAHLVSWTEETFLSSDVRATDDSTVLSLFSCFWHLLMQLLFDFWSTEQQQSNSDDDAGTCRNTTAWPPRSWVICEAQRMSANIKGASAFLTIYNLFSMTDFTSSIFQNNTSPSFSIV